MSMIELEEATKVQELSTLKVKVNIRIYEKITELSLFLCNFAKDLMTVIDVPEYWDDQGPAKYVQDAANFFTNKMADEFQPEMKSCCSEIVDTSSSLEHIIQSIYISDMQLRKTGAHAECNCMPEPYHPSAMKAFLALSIGFEDDNVDVNRPDWACECNERVKCMLQIPLALRAILDKHRIHLQRVKLSADTAKTFARLLINNIPFTNETDPEEAFRDACLCSFKGALKDLQRICGEYK